MFGHTTPQAPHNRYNRLHASIGVKAAVVTAVTGLALGLGATATGTSAHAETGTTNASSGATVLQTAQTVSRKAARSKKLTVKQRNKAHGRELVKKRGWSDRQFGCLAKLWTKESNWNHRAYNSSSGAGGIPQALPASKMGSAGSDWRTNPRTQIKWGLRYIKGRYGTPCGAWAHFQSRNWY